MGYITDTLEQAEEFRGKFSLSELDFVALTLEINSAHSL